jgi:hypothetical protein
MRSLNIFIAALALLIAGARLEAKVIRIVNLAKLQDFVISDRQVAIDEAIEHPESFSESSRTEHRLSREKQDEALDRVLVQYMIVEENRLFANERVSDDEIKVEKTKLLKKFGDKKWRAFTSFYGLSEEELKQKLREKILFRKALATKLKSTRDNPESGIRDWIKQLKSRYKVQYFLRERPTQEKAP